MVKCSFCHNAVQNGTGKMYIKKDATIWYFCSSKCEKNMVGLGRNPRTTTWTAEYARVKHASAEEKARKK